MNVDASGIGSPTIVGWRGDHEILDAVVGYVADGVGFPTELIAGRLARQDVDCLAFFLALGLCGATADNNYY